MKWRTIKVTESEYRAIKALAKKRGQYLSHVISESLKQYLAAQSKEESQGGGGNNPSGQKAAAA